MAPRTKPSTPKKGEASAASVVAPEDEFLRFADEMTGEIAIAKAARLAHLPVADRELVHRVETLEDLARSIRALINNPEAFAPFRDGAALLAARKGEALATLRRIHNARVGARADDGAPYLGARLQFADGVVFYGRLERGDPSTDNGVARAARLALRIGELYPSLASRFLEAKRREAVRIAILTRSKRTTMPWEQIATAWEGLEPWENLPEAWRDLWRKRGE